MFSNLRLDAGKKFRRVGKIQLSFLRWSNFGVTFDWLKDGKK
jgi:hypothetical protein